MELYFLGTVAGTPSKERNVSSTSLKLYNERGTFWLFDCGEGTQHQILRSSLRLSKLEYIFITHMHGDHVYGLPGLLTSRSYHEGAAPLKIYGPSGIREYLETVLRLSQAHLDYHLTIEEIHHDEHSIETLFEDEQFIVKTAWLNHRVPCLGYRIEEKQRMGKLRQEKLAELGIKPGPVYAEIKAGKNITLPDGQTLPAKDYLDAAPPGRVLTILGDTRPCEQATKLAANADVLVHEATFAADKEDLAERYYHSSSRQAAMVAREANADMLILNHFSSRYQGQAIHQLKKEAEGVHANVELAADFKEFPVSR